MTFFYTNSTKVVSITFFRELVVSYRKPHVVKWFRKPLVPKAPYDMKIFADSSNEGWTLEKIYQRERREAESRILMSLFVKSLELVRVS